MKVLVTGARGFVGRCVCTRLQRDGFDVLKGSRFATIDEFDRVTPELDDNSDWSEVLTGVGVVVHLAARAHITLNKDSNKVEEIYDRINARGTERLADQAREAGVKHFVFLSSCHAVASSSDVILNSATAPGPDSAYGRSKLAAERKLENSLRSSNTSFTILRPPLVYGPGNLANFAKLFSLVRSGLPLPFGNIQNRRSFIGVENLADVIRHCIDCPVAFGKRYFPSDGPTVSTPDLIREIASSMSMPARLVPIPETWLSFAAQLPGFAAIGKLTSSLFVDSAELMSDVQWSPRLTLAQGLSRIAHTRPE